MNNREISEDGLRAKEEITRLLLSAGYFRVRMPDLDDFDKIAGGLAWGLKASAVDVDVDIFFKEKPNIGEKIRIAESICKGLQIVKCPIQIVAHQIQGLDYPKLFPAFQYLVKKVIATREEFGDFQRSYAEFTFRNRYSQLPSDMKVSKNLTSSISNVTQMQSFFPPRRIYKRQSWNLQLPELKQTETTLLEYGRIPKAVIPHSSGPSAQFGSKSGGKQLSEEEIAAAEEARQKDLRDTLRGMTHEDGGDITGPSETLNQSVIDFVSKNAAAILEGQSTIESVTRQKTEAEEASKFEAQHITRSDLVSQHNIQVEKVTAQLNAVKIEGRKLRQKAKDLSDKKQELQDQLEDLTNHQKELLQKKHEAEAILKNSGKNVAIVEREIQLRDQTTASIDEFTKQCQKEKKEWETKIQDLRNLLEADTGDSRLYPALEQYQKEWERKQVLLADKTRKVLKLRSEYDEVPTIAELTQYDRRLNELSLLSLQKLAEQRKNDQLDNALIESGKVLERENELFNSILSTFNSALNSSSNQQAMLSMMRDIASQTKQSRVQITQELEKKETSLHALEEKHRKLLENQRRYFQAVKEYQEAFITLQEMGGDEEEDDDDE